MLKENPKSRPNIYQVLREACLMQGLEVPIKDVCRNPCHMILEAHDARFTLEGHSQNPGAISNYHPQNQV